MLRHDGTHDVLHGGAVDFAQAKPDAIGAALAGAVWQGMTR
jgi:hypothetical protein